MLNFDRRILLPDPVLVDNQILPTDIWNEVSVWILHEQFDGYRPGRRIEVNFGSLLARAYLEQRLRPAR